MSKLKNKSLLNKRNFSWLEREKTKWLHNLSLKKAIRLQESLLSSKLIWEWRKNFSKDNPLSLKESLRKKKL